MLQSKLKWRYIETPNENIHWTDEANDLSPVMKELLVQRGVTSEEEALEFLSPNLASLLNPSKLHTIEMAGNRVHKAIKNKEKILVFGDYDADGVSSTTVMIQTLQELGANCEYYIPNRFTEGYGLNAEAIEAAYSNGFRLIITVDTGISAVDEAKRAQELGVDLIITDHHEPQDELPDAFAIIHPKCSPGYHFKELAGVGVAFKFAEYLLGYFPEQFLDLVAIGTIADLVPLVGENRILAYHGLRKLAVTSREGIRALKRQCKIDGKVTEEDVGFLIGPRLNAVGRLQDADLAVQLLATDNQLEAEELAEIVQELNEERKKIVASIVAEAEKLVTPEDNVIIVAKEGWNEGVLGIVASRLVRKYDRPAIVLSINEEHQYAKGSARSIPAFDLFKNCLTNQELFTHFGGHAQAAGMTLPVENIEKLRVVLHEAIQKQLSPEDFKQEIVISKKLNVAEISLDLIADIGRLAPFGMANPKPMFHIEAIPEQVRQLGNMNKHLKFQFMENSVQVEGIAFGMGAIYQDVTPNTLISVVGELDINEWNGMKKLQMVINDMKIDQWQLFDHRGKKNVDIISYMVPGKRHVVLRNKNTEEDYFPAFVEQITYGSDPHLLKEVDVLYVLDLPIDEEQLINIVKAVRPTNIHVCFYVEHSVYMSSFPTREDFKWYYAYIWKKRSIDLKKELNWIMDAKGWTKDTILFMSKVFLELDFVKIDNGIVAIIPAPMKKDLGESLLYQQRIKQGKVEQVLYYSTYEELYQWFSLHMSLLDKPKEEVIDGL